jgi:hypothetical protein
MFATGNSACEAVGLLKCNSATQIQFVCIIACLPGLCQLQSRHPDVHIFTVAIDPELNEFGHIVPGLGYAGDRYFGTGSDRPPTVGWLHAATCLQFGHFPKFSERARPSAIDHAFTRAFTHAPA